MEIIIRKATINDLRDVLRLNFDLFKKEYKEFDKSLSLKWTYGRRGTEYFKERIIKSDGFVVVADKDGEIVGYLCGGLRSHGHRAKAIYAELENMIVDKKLRGKGVGTKMTQEFIKWCKSKKVKYIDVVASFKNKQGIEFYRSLGFNDYDLKLEKKL